MVDFAAHSANMINSIGQPVTIAAAGGGLPRTVMAVVAVSPADVFQAENYACQARVANVDIDCVEVGDNVDIGDRQFVVARRDIDAIGGTTVLHLK